MPTPTPTPAPKWLDSRWLNEYDNGGAGDYYYTTFKLTAAPTVEHNDIVIPIAYNGRCWIDRYMTKAEQSEILAMLDVGDTVTVQGKLGAWWREGGPRNPSLSPCSIIKVEKGIETIPWSDIWNEGWNDVYRQARPSVVGVEATNGGQATGWVYEPGWVVTAAHVVDDRSVVEIHYQDNGGRVQTAEGRVMGRDRLRDLAAVKLPEGVQLPAFSRYSPTSDMVGMNLMLMGYSGSGVYPDASSGELSKVKRCYIAGQQIITLEAGLQSIGGDSGGVYVNRNGSAVGISQAGHRAFGSDSVGVSVEEIEKVWERLKAGGQLNAGYDRWFKRQGC